MDALYRVAPLGEDEDARGFALVNFYDARVRPEDWRIFLEAEQAGGSRDRETVVIQDRRGYAHAVLTTWPDYDLIHGKILHARALACNETPGRLLHETIMAAAEERARAVGCGGVVMELAADHGSVSNDFETSMRGAGFSRVSAAYYRALPRS
ncbi:MAG: hypothetical protein HZY79_14860 [Rhodoblastus sp.]|nr:MAG: hypothetical protein HZY79_14860 [Rhodoblastus sp.]